MRSGCFIIELLHLIYHFSPHRYIDSQEERECESTYKIFPFGGWWCCWCFCSFFFRYFLLLLYDFAIFFSPFIFISLRCVCVCVRFFFSASLLKDTSLLPLFEFSVFLRRRFSSHLTTVAVAVILLLLLHFHFFPLHLRLLLLLPSIAWLLSFVLLFISLTL